MTTTYYAPRPRPADPRTPRTTSRPAPDGDVRQMLGVALPDGYAWTHRPTLTVIYGGDPNAPGQDELQTRACMIRAISRWGVSA
ncbi:hypothetical protein ACFVT1_36410 [Streptomyces sp. NPDC057963]|uniref:hypothetical protein n=1 Tax=Streptomyces sp. NPDC057963 TaxID=3346290 RepID=UPI0036EF92C4